MTQGAASVPVSVTVRAPAKVNLHLGVGAPRGDGFHPLLTVYQAISLCDEVVAAASPRWRLELEAADHLDAAAVPLDGHNIAARAAELLARHHGRAPTAGVLLRKRIPVAGGLAGGSADAAATLVALDELWGLATPRPVLLELAAELGSDVPFALVGGTAIGTGRGELVAPVSDAGRWHWVVVGSAEGLSTPAVYRHFDRLFPDAPAIPPSADELLDALVDGSPTRLSAALHNDLQPAALDLRPDLERLVERGESEGALRGLVSGSGPTCVFLCESASSAAAVAEALRGAGHAIALTATGAEPGAHVVQP